MPSQAKLAVRAEADKLKARLVRLAVNEDEVGPDVAIAVIAPLATELVIEIPPGQRLVLRQHVTVSSNSASRRLLCRPDFSRL